MSEGIAVTSGLHEWLPGWPINQSVKILWVYFHLVTSLGLSGLLSQLGLLMLVKKTQKNKKWKKTLFVSFLMLSLASPSHFFLLCSTSCTGRNFKVHPLQNLSYTIERFIQMSVVLLQVLSQHDPVAPQIGSESTVNFSVPWWLSVCTMARFFGNILQVG